MAVRDQGKLYYNASGGARSVRDIATYPLHDTNDLEFVTKWIYVSVAGVVSGVAAGDSVAQLVPVAVGYYDLTQFKRLRSTGTTATITHYGGD